MHTRALTTTTFHSMELQSKYADDYAYTRQELTMMEGNQDKQVDETLREIQSSHCKDGQWISIMNHCNSDKLFAEKLVDGLSKCNCCDRHKIDRPTAYLPREQIPMKIGKRPYENPCKCSCRILSRFICRELWYDLNV